MCVHCVLSARKDISFNCFLQILHSADPYNKILLHQPPHLPPKPPFVSLPSAPPIYLSGSIHDILYRPQHSAANTPNHKPRHYLQQEQRTSPRKTRPNAKGWRGRGGQGRVTRQKLKNTIASGSKKTQQENVSNIPKPAQKHITIPRLTTDIPEETETRGETKLSKPPPPQPNHATGPTASWTATLIPQHPIPLPWRTTATTSTTGLSVNFSHLPVPSLSRNPNSTPALLPRTKQHRSGPLPLLSHYQRAESPHQQTRARGTLGGTGHGAAGGGGGLLLAGRFVVVVALALVLVALLQPELELLLLSDGLL